jgi:cell wall-associated NlpC family hydrolase
LFARFAPAPEEEQFKFGTLVFFSNLTHVGVVADEHGFYHASRRHGVVYQEFNEYWLKRIDGFRRVPLPLPVTD